jgi:hypothetical protein
MDGWNYKTTLSYFELLSVFLRMGEHGLLARKLVAK